MQDFGDTLQRDFRPRFEGRRVFVPIATAGCGWGCAYCYIPSPKQPVASLPEDVLRHDLEELERAGAFSVGPGGTVISVGCDSEPFVTPTSTARTLAILRWARERDNPVQLATKSRLPPDAVDELDRWNDNDSIPTVFTSITSVAHTDRLEPGAPPAEVRATNFAHQPRAWVSAAMVKPYLAATERDRDALVDLFARTRPDAIVVGTHYRANGRGKAHPFEATWAAVPGTLSGTRFVAALGDLDMPVFHHSLCVSATTAGDDQALEVFREHPSVCAQCGLCPSLGDPS